MDQLVEKLQSMVGKDAVLFRPDELLVYECDGLTQHKHLPRAVVFPGSTEETSEVMRVIGEAKVPFTPRGAGTGLSGGALALERGVVIELARLRRILRIDEANRLAVVETGVVNSHVSRAVASLGLHYVPDPSSQPTCTIGGNIGENAGGVHCLKYGTTTDHVLAIRVVLAGGSIVDLGGITGEQPGYDLRGVFIGSEGTFGIATEATLRLVPIPPSVRTLLAEFAEVDQASHAVSAIIAAGVVPAGLEMMDREIIRAVEASVFAAGLPPDAGAALLIELDGLEVGIDDDAERVKNICLQYGARSCRLARDEAERKKLWAARKGAFGAIGRIAPDSMIQDAVVPRSRLPEIMANAYQIASKYKLRIANVFHAGDGNLHPLICFDSRSAEEVMRVKEAGRELMETCVRAGGSITGEHGVGLDKRDLLSLIFSEDDLDVMLHVRAAFDPSGLLNPGKIIPLLRGCGEARVSHERTGQTDKKSGRVADAENGRSGEPHKQVPQFHADTQNSIVIGSQLSPETIAKQMAAILGDEYVSLFTFSPSPVPPFSPPPVITTPPTIEAAAEVLKLASKQRWSVLPAGQGTWLDAGNPLDRVDVIISTAQLNRIIEHEPADLVAIAESGVTLHNLNQMLKQKGQWLPLDPLGQDQSTIGGIVATGTAGPQKYGYGPTRGFVIGLKVLLANGKLIKAGGRVVKNVAGYDLCKLFTGSYGTLGLIVEANFKLRPRPERESSVILSGSAAALIAAARAILATPLLPVGLELLSPSVGSIVLLETGDTLLVVRFAGSHKAVKKQAETVLTFTSKGSGIVGATIVEEDADLWQRLTLPEPRLSNKLSWRATVPPAGLSSFMQILREAYAERFNSLRWQAGIGDGRIQVVEEFQEQSDNVGFLQRLRRDCETAGGSLILERAPLQVKSQFDAWGELSRSGPLMQRIKQQLDPAAILSPGRFRF